MKYILYYIKLNFNRISKCLLLLQCSCKLIQMKVCVEASGIQAYGPTDNSQVCRIKPVEQKQSCNEYGNTSTASFFKTLLAFTV